MQTGRYGPFVQLSSTKDDDKRSTSLTKGLKYSTVTLVVNWKFLEYPIRISEHEKPTSHNQHRAIWNIFKTWNSKLFDKDAIIKTLDQAIDLIEMLKKEKASKQIHTFTHDDNDLLVLNGRFGPYISYKKNNYKIPKETDPTKINIDESGEALLKNAPKKKKRRKK